MNENVTTPEQFARLLKSRGGSQAVAILSKYRPFMDAYQTSVGKEILSDAVAIYDSLLAKIANLEATPEETMEYRAVLRLIRRWSDKIMLYQNAINELQK